MMRRRVGLEHVGRTLGVVARVAIAGAVAAGLAYGAWYGLDAVLGDGFVAQLVSLGAGFAVAGLVYVGLARALGTSRARGVATVASPLMRKIGIRSRRFRSRESLKASASRPLCLW